MQGLTVIKRDNIPVHLNSMPLSMPLSMLAVGGGIDLKFFQHPNLLSNMTNPSGYVFPEFNGTRPFERIPVSEKDKLEAFASHKQPDWKIPLYQQILDWVSGLTVLAGMVFLFSVSIKRLITRFRHRENAVTKA